MKFRIQEYLYPVEVVQHHNRMKSAPHWPPERLAIWTLERRKAIVTHAYNHVPYYRKLFAETGVEPDKLNNPEVWNRIPSLEKGKLRSNTEELIAKGKYRRGSMGCDIWLYRYAAQDHA